MRGRGGAARARPGPRTERAAAPALLALLTLSACGDGGSGSGPAGLPDFPPPEPPPPAAVSAADFVGAEACGECHDEVYAAWAPSTHGRAGGAPSPATVIAPFDGRPMRFADAVVTPRVRAGAYEFVVRQDGFDELVYRVDGVIGGGHMIGGGTQGFVSRLPDGTERFLPWDWSDDGRTWFCNTGSRKGDGWVPVTPELRLADCGDWPPLRPLGSVDRFANCQECHGSQIRTVWDPDSLAWRTGYTTLRVNCESCHGPGAEHVARARDGRLAAGDAAAIGSLAWRGKDESLTVCFQCHALKDVVREGYLPGDSLALHFALKFPTLGDRPYFADGRVRTFAYQANHLASACYLQGPMDCVSCHEPHGQGYRDVEGRALDGPFDDGQCTACHASKGVAPAEHSRHPAEGAGAVRCVDCHMPYLQHPEVGPRIPFARSDHTIAVPRPVFDADLGLTGACAQCHEDRSPLQLQADARALWGELKPHRPLVQAQVDELRARNLAEATELLLRPDETDPLLQFQAMGRLLTGYLPPDAPLPGDATEDLLRLARAPDPDVRALALASLHWTGGDRPEVRRPLVEALSGDPEARALRDRWVLALGFLGDHYRGSGETERSRRAYRKALEVRPDDPRVQANLGLLLHQSGDPASAAEWLRASLDGDPDRPLTWVNLGIARAAAGDPAGAREAYTEALRRNPHEALAHFNLGNLHQRAGRHADAAAAYRAAVRADPGLGRGWFELGRTLIRLERYAEALPAARRAVEFLPDHAPSRQMLADLEQAAGG